jgi:hypothetical protein
LEREKVVRQGSLKACIAILLGVWVVFSFLTLALVLIAFLLLRSMLSNWLAATLPETLFNAGYFVVIICIALAVAAGILAGGSEVLGAIGAAKRRRFHFNPSQPNTGNPAVQEVDIPMQAGPGRRIVILCDGTSNKPDNHPDGESIATNIWKLSGFLVTGASASLMQVIDPMTRGKGRLS